MLSPSKLSRGSEIPSRPKNNGYLHLLHVNELTHCRRTTTMVRRACLATIAAITKQSRSRRSVFLRLHSRVEHVDERRVSIKLADAANQHHRNPEIDVTLWLRPANKHAVSTRTIANDTGRRRKRIDRVGSPVRQPSGLSASGKRR